jgi:site-specific DNA-methyltransferase (adenine-specific)
MKSIEEFKNKIICGDVLEVLQKIPDESIDCIITDPPFMISQKGKKIIRNIKHYKWKRRSDIGLDFGEWDRQWSGIQEYFEWTERWFKECVRVLKNGSWIYIFFDKQKIGIFDLYLAPKYNIKSRTIFVWVKSNPVPSFRKVNWNSGTEFIWVGSKGNSKLKNFLAQKYMANYMITPNASSYKKTNHPTEKPEILLERLILVNSNPNDIILDPFCGSGTTCVVAKKLGRNYIGIDISKEYCEISEKRLERTQSPLIL